MKLKSKIHIRKAEKFIQRFHSFIKTIAKFKNKLGIGTTPVKLSRGFSQPAFSGFPTFYQNKDSTQWERCSLNRNRCVLLNITFHILIFPRVVTPMFFNYEKCIRENRKKNIGPRECIPTKYIIYFFDPPIMTLWWAAQDCLMIWDRCVLENHKGSWRSERVY